MLQKSTFHPSSIKNRANEDVRPSSKLAENLKNGRRNSPTVNFSSSLGPLRDVHNATWCEDLIQLAGLQKVLPLSSCTSCLCWIHLLSDDVRWQYLYVLHWDVDSTDTMDQQGRGKFILLLVLYHQCFWEFHTYFTEYTFRHLSKVLLTKCKWHQKFFLNKIFKGLQLLVSRSVYFYFTSISAVNILFKNLVSVRSTEHELQWRRYIKKKFRQELLEKKIEGQTRLGSLDP